MVPEKSVGILRNSLRKLPKLQDKVLHLVVAHLSSSHMVEQFGHALLAKEALNLPAVAHLDPRF